MSTEIQADIVIAGGGTAGCVVAARVCAAFPDLKVIIVENGADSEDDPSVQKPLLGISQLFTGPPSLKLHHSKPSDHLDGRAAVVPTGNILGGGSAVNLMTYNNAAASDFDDWNQPGWSFKEVHPLLNKTVTYHPEDTQKVHGTQGGPVQVTYGGHQSNVKEHFYTAAAATQDLPKLDDLADFHHGHGYGQWAKYITPQGQRSFAAGSYLWPNGGQNRAVGIEITAANQIPTGEGANPTLFTPTRIFASRQVVLCSGGMGSSAILERSGVGNPEVLKPLGIENKVDLPGVGREYEDHQMLFGVYHVAEEIETLDTFIRGDEGVREAAEKEWLATGKGLMATNGNDFGFKIRPTDEDLQKMGKDVDTYWRRVGHFKPDKPILTGVNIGFFPGDHSTMFKGNYMTTASWLNYPASRGSVHISSSDSHTPLDFDSGMLSHPADLPVHVWGYKWIRELARRMPCYRGEPAAAHPAFPEGSAATCRRYDSYPFSNQETITHIEYTKEDDQAIETWVKKTVATTWHSMATCPMRERKKGGVVSSRLDVYETERLKIADLSIIPSNVGTNPASVALLIGEKCAECIVQELRA